MKILNTYKSIYKIVPSKRKYLSILFLFIIISIFDLISISTLSLLLANILNVNINFKLLDNIGEYSNYNLLFFLFILILLKQIFYLFIFYKFLKYSYELKNLFIYRYLKTKLNYRKPQDKKEDFLNFIRVIEEFTFNSLIPSFQFLFEVIVIITITGYILFWDIKSSLSILFIFIIIGSIYYKIVPKIISNLGEKNLFLNKEILKIISYVHDGIREIIIYKKTINFLDPLKNSLNTLKKNLIIYDMLNAIPRISFEVILILSLGIIFIINNNLSNNFLLNSSIFIFAFTKLIPSLIKFTNIMNSINYGGFALNLISEVNKDFKKSSDINHQYETNTQRDFDKISIKGLTKIFQSENKDFKIRYPDIEIIKGEKILISSKSGKGKSTLLDMICDFQEPNTGKIMLVHKYQEYKLNTDLIYYLPQFNLILDEDFDNNIEMKILNHNNGSINFRSSLFAKSFFSNNLNILKNSTLNNSSGGEKKRIGLLRLILNFSNQKKILIFDEPTASLDEQNKKIFYNWIKEIKDVTIIIASHDHNYHEVFDRVIYL